MKNLFEESHLGMLNKERSEAKKKKKKEREEIINSRRNYFEYLLTRMSFKIMLCSTVEIRDYNYFTK